MINVPLVDENDVVTRGKKKEKDTTGIEAKREKKIKKEKPVRILRIKYHEKIALPFMEEGKLGHKDAFAVNRGLESLLKNLYFNTNIEMKGPPDCIFVEKDYRMGFNNKFIFIEIIASEFPILKRELESPTVTYAFNMGELSILEGKPSSLSETWSMPKLWRH